MFRNILISAALIYAMTLLGENLQKDIAKKEHVDATVVKTKA